MKPNRESSATKACIRYETPPGKQAQVDWAEFKHESLDGTFMKVHVFVVVLGYSKCSM